MTVDSGSPNNSMQRTALRAAADAERWADTKAHPSRMVAGLSSTIEEATSWAKPPTTIMATEPSCALAVKRGEREGNRRACRPRPARGAQPEDVPGQVLALADPHGSGRLLGGRHPDDLSLRGARVPWVGVDIPDPRHGRLSLWWLGLFEGAWRELEARLPGMMTLISLAISVAFIFSWVVQLGLIQAGAIWWEMATLVTIMLLEPLDRDAFDPAGPGRPPGAGEASPGHRDPLHGRDRGNGAGQRTPEWGPHTCPSRRARSGRWGWCGKERAISTRR